jgi:hypothetical protein
MKNILEKTKYLIVAVCFAIAIYCFLIKLPKPLRKIDTELHAVFFFSVAAFLNLLFTIKKLDKHFLVFGMLFLFGALIEFAQEYSNIVVKKKIHGKFDPLDLKYDLLGLLCFSTIWFVYYLYTCISKNNIKST